MAAPSTLLSSCADYSVLDIVKGILKTSELPQSSHICDEIYSYPWHVDTKYYTADIRLCTTPTRTLGDRDFADSVHALVLYFNTQEQRTFDSVKQWIPFIKEIEPSVQLLLCQRSKEGDVVPKATVVRWCLDNEFELIELEPEDSEDDEEDDFKEDTGMSRVIHALHAHPWPNLTMKESPMVRSPYMQSMMESSEQSSQNQDETESSVRSRDEPGAERRRPGFEDAFNSLALSSSESPATVTTFTEEECEVNAACAASLSSSSVPNSLQDKSAKNLRNFEEKILQESCYGSGASSIQNADGGTSSDGGNELKAQKKQSNEEQRRSTQSYIDTLMDDEAALLAALGNEDPGDQSLEALFSNMRRMKERAENLPADQRKVYAEKIAIAFWRAIGGDEEEIEDDLDFNDQ